MSKLRTEKISENALEIFFGDDHKVGEFIRDVDGFFYFWPVEGPGAWSEHTLRWISTALELLNKAWNDQINEYFTKEREKE